jgi:hypothetical protein
MSQYIATTNQDMLWNMFQKIPEVSQYSMVQRQDTFRNSISYFYQQMNPQAGLSREQLQELNKQTLSYLLDQVRPRVPLPVPQQQPQQQQQQMVESPEEKTQRIFEEKQKQYDDLTRKPELPKPSDLFQEPTTDNDGAIQNMDELISQYQEQRSQEIPAYEPIPNPNPNAPIDPSNNTVESSNTLNTILTILQRLEQRMDTLESHFSGLDQIMS